MKIEGLKITKVLPLEEGTSKASGKAWKKVVFVGETSEQYNNLYAFELFQGEGKENVDNFLKFNKEGDLVDVDFNVQCREWEGKYFTSLSAWKVFKSEAESDNGLNNPDPNTGEVDEDDLPF